MVFLQVFTALITWSIFNVFLLILFVKFLGKSTAKSLIEPITMQMREFEATIGSITKIVKGVFK